MTKLYYRSRFAITLLFLILFAQSSGLKAQEIKKIYFKDVAANCAGKQWEDHYTFATGNEGKIDETAVTSTINNCIKGKYLTNYKFKQYNGDWIQTDSIGVPMVFVMAGSWCPPCLREIPIINTIASKYQGRIEVLVLFWDSRKTMRKMAEKYETAIRLVPAKRPFSTGQKSPDFGNEFYHQGPIPATYFIDGKKRIHEFKLGIRHPNESATNDEVTAHNIDVFSRVIEDMLE